MRFAKHLSSWYYIEPALPSDNIPWKFKVYPLKVNTTFFLTSIILSDHIALFRFITYLNQRLVHWCSLDSNSYDHLSKQSANISTFLLLLLYSFSFFVFPPLETYVKFYPIFYFFKITQVCKFSFFSNRANIPSY